MNETLSEAKILERVELILRRDLKLGPDAPIPPDMPFFGGDMDLDSLDILLLVTSIEKEFGVKIPSSDVGQEVFQNVTTLTSYIQRNLNHAASSGVVASATTMTPTAPSAPDYLSQLPHRDPFRFITSVTRVTEGESAEGTWKVTGDEPFFAGHFPNNPIVPGVLLTEALAQISGIAGTKSDARGAGGGVLAHVDVRFDKPIAPPAQITLQSRLTRVMGALQQFEITARVGDAVVASGSITLHRAAESGS